MEKSRFSLGLIIILVGVVILLGKLGVFHFVGAIFWPIFVLAPGILFHLLFFGRLLPSGGVDSRRNSGYLFVVVFLL